MLVKDNFLYTGIQGGNIVRLDLKNPQKPWETVVKTGRHCLGQYEENKCGRPLGLEWNIDGHLIVADASQGLMKVDIETKKITTLVPSTLDIQGKQNRITNFVTVARDGTLYYTSSSSLFHLGEGVLEFFSSGSGRLLRYDPKTNTSKVLLNGISFANGVALSENEDFILVNEVGKARIMKYHLKGDLVDQVETILDTPGSPDNIRRVGNDRYLIGIPNPLLPDRFSLVADLILRHSFLTRWVSRVTYGIKMIPELINRYVFEHAWLQKASYWAANFEGILPILPKYGLVIEINGAGTILRSWHGPKGRVPFVCEALTHDGYMYLASPFNEFLARVRLEK